VPRAGENFEGKTLHLQAWGGYDKDVIRRLVADPMEKETGVKVVYSEGYTSQSVAKVKATAANPELDVVMMDDVGTIALGNEGLLDTLDLERMPNSGRIHPKFIIGGGKGISYGYYCDCLVGNTDVVKTPPDSFQEMWNPAYRGKTIYPSMEWSDGHKWIIACAMAWGEDPFTISDSTWDKIKELKDNMNTIFQVEALHHEQFKSGELVFGFMQAGKWREAIENGYPIKNYYTEPKEGYFTIASNAVMIKGHPADEEVIYSYINRLLAPETQAEFAKVKWWAPTNRDADKLVSDELKELIPVGEEARETGISVNLDHLAAMRPVWMDRWNKL
jgi:putative spermidine/putrescine transport system substrate-binding protein